MMRLMRLNAGPLVWAVVLILGTSCATIIHEAVQRDMYEYGKNQPDKALAAEQEEETPWICPPKKIQVEDCRVTPCQVTCEDPKEPKR